MTRIVTGVGAAALIAAAFGNFQPQAPRGVALADISWPEAEKVLMPSSVVVIPLGGGAVEQGPQLTLGAYDRIARYVTSRVEQTASVVVAPTLTYHFYSSFLEYPGSTSLTEATARDMTIEVVRSLAAAGPRRFYVVNIGDGPLTPLSRAAHTLENDGILLGYTDYDFRLRRAANLRQSPVRLAHADEAETSMMLFLDPGAVDISKAVREYGQGTGALTRKLNGTGTFSASGVIGDPTLATREEGHALLESLVAGVLDDIEHLRSAPLPEPKPATAARLVPTPPIGRGSVSARTGCTVNDERLIREVGYRFSSLWRQLDADGIAMMFTKDGDMRHPDGTIERGRDVIRQNRAQLFSRPEYVGSVHSVLLNDIRCLDGDQALADGKWELRLTSPLKSPNGGSSSPTKNYSGWCTLVLTRGDDGWVIEAWRYTMNPENGAPPPNVMKQPGFIGRER